MDLYVYYKVREEDGARLLPRVSAMLGELAQGGVRGALKRRPDARDGLQTWMEVYPGVTDAFASRLERAVLEAGLLEFTSGPRRAEVFVDLNLTASASPCA